MQYLYTEENGKLLYVVEKTAEKRRVLLPSDDGKKLLPANNLNGTRRVPYLLNHLSRYPKAPVVIVDDEEDADRIFIHFDDLFATSYAKEAGSWLQEWGKHFKNRKIVIVPAETADRKFSEARKIASTLLSVTKDITIMPCERKHLLKTFEDLGYTKAEDPRSEEPRTHVSLEECTIRRDERTGAKKTKKPAFVEEIRERVLVPEWELEELQELEKVFASYESEAEHEPEALAPEQKLVEEPKLEPKKPEEECLCKAIDELPEGATLHQVEQALRALAEELKGKDAIHKEVARTWAIHKLKAVGLENPSKMVDAAVPSSTSVAESEKNTGYLFLDEIKISEESVNGVELLDAVEVTLKRFLVLPDGGSSIAALWVLFAHCYEAFEIAPYLVITSPVKRCGKTTFLLVMASLTPRPLPTANISAAAVYRTVEKFHPTMFIDESDAWLHDNDMLRGILNSGHNKALSITVRLEGDEREPIPFSAFGPKAIAVIGRLPDTLEDRSMILRMRRRRPNETVERFRLALHQHELKPIREKLARWAQDHLPMLSSIDPHIPDEITSDRARDNWRVLLAIADLVGGSWPERARNAAKNFFDDEMQAENYGVLLLRDIRDIFTVRSCQRLASSAIISELVKMEHRPWPEFGRNKKPLTATGMARILSFYEIHPKGMRIDDKTDRGYEKTWFEDAWSRYLPAMPEPSPATEESTAEPPPVDDGRKALADLWLAEHPYWKENPGQHSQARPELERAIAVLLDEGREKEELEELLRYICHDVGDRRFPGWGEVMSSPSYLLRLHEDRVRKYYDVILYQMNRNRRDPVPGPEPVEPPNPEELTEKIEARKRQENEEKLSRYRQILLREEVLLALPNLPKTTPIEVLLSLEKCRSELMERKHAECTWSDDEIRARYADWKSREPERRKAERFAQEEEQRSKARQVLEEAEAEKQKEGLSIVERAKLRKEQA